jgi:phospholipid transport system substrate-binding protein
MRNWFALLAAVLGLVVVAPTARADDSAASKVVARLNAALLDVLQHAEQLGFKGRADKIAPVVADTFDVPFMAEKSIGRFWKPLSDADKARWVDLFRELTSANYAGNFDHFSGQKFEILGEEAGENDTTVVHTKVMSPGIDDVELNYRLRTTPAGARIVDVYLKGTVSELALRRSDFTSVLERDGFDGLVASVHTKIADLAAGRAKRQPR